MFKTIRYFFILFLSLFILGLSLQESEKPNANPIHIKKSYFLENYVVMGSISKFRIELYLDKGFKAYKKIFKLNSSPYSDTLKRITISPTSFWKDPHKRKKQEIVKDNFFIEGFFEIPISKEGTNTINLSLTYQACNKKYCLFPKNISIPLVYQASRSIGSSEQQNLTSDKRSLIEKKLKKVIGTSILMALLFCFLAGILTSFTPCVFPMIPITLAVLGTQDSKTSRFKTFLISLSYVLGIATTYSVLGFFAAQTGSIFGSYLQSPYVVFGISFLFILMGLSMYGLFDLPFPSFQKLSKYKPAQNFRGSYITGLITGIVASPCVGPVLVVILTYAAQTQNSLYAMALLFVYALGIGQIFLLLGLSSRWISQMPKSGNWLRVSRFIFGTIMIILAFYFSKPLLTNYFPEIFKTQQKNLLRWQPYSDSQFQKLIKSGRPIVLDFYADWCVACKDIELDVVNSETIKKYHNLIHWVKLDATTSDVKFLKLRKKYNIVGLPHLEFFDKNGRRRKELILQNLESVQNFEKRIKVILGR